LFSGCYDQEAIGYAPPLFGVFLRPARRRRVLLRAEASLPVLIYF
jgi:hypothetical protein